MQLHAQTATFTYQGRLNQDGTLVDGSRDMTFALFRTALGNDQVGATLRIDGVQVTNGRFEVQLNFDPNAFTGPERWLEIGVGGPPGNAISLLSPRQLITPTPYAIMAYSAGGLTGTLPATQISGILLSSSLQGAYDGALTFSNPGNQYFGNGSGLFGVDADTLGGFSADEFWRLEGNGGTTAGVNFLGTTDDEPLELKVNLYRALRLEPGYGNPNIIGGFTGNYAHEGAFGVTIAGGGTAGAENFVDLGFIDHRDATNSSFFAVIGGGAGNQIKGGEYTTISGGKANRVYIIADEFLSSCSTIGGGVSNVLGGKWNSGSTIGGGRANSIISDIDRADDGTIGGGTYNSIETSGEDASRSTIAGGSRNRVFAREAMIGGGVTNTINEDAIAATIAGGGNNQIRAGFGVISGGMSNFINNFAVGGTIGGGAFNQIAGDIPAVGYATIPGGLSNTATNFAFAAGRRAKAVHQGAFVWADSSDFDFVSTVANGFSARCLGGARFVSAINLAGTPIAGVSMATGGGSWSSLSDRNAKENLAPINPSEVLERVNRMPISTWNYKSQDAAIRHIGPMAQDFAEAFRVGEDNRSITTVDADGVALAAIQGLSQKLAEKDRQIESLEKKLSRLEQRLSQLDQRLAETTASPIPPLALNRGAEDSDQSILTP